MKLRHKRHLDRASGGRTMPDLVSGNPKVIAEAKKTTSLGKIPGIYAKGRLDRAPRKGKMD